MNFFIKRWHLSKFDLRTFTKIRITCKNTSEFAYEENNTKIWTLTFSSFLTWRQRKCFAKLLANYFCFLHEPYFTWENLSDIISEIIFPISLSFKRVAYFDAFLFVFFFAHSLLNNRTKCTNERQIYSVWDAKISFVLGRINQSCVLLLEIPLSSKEKRFETRIVCSTRFYYRW